MNQKLVNESLNEFWGRKKKLDKEVESQSDYNNVPEVYHEIVRLSENVAYLYDEIENNYDDFNEFADELMEYFIDNGLRFADGILMPVETNGHSTWANKYTLEDLKDIEEWFPGEYEDEYSGSFEEFCNNYVNKLGGLIEFLEKYI